MNGYNNADRTARPRENELSVSQERAFNAGTEPAPWLAIQPAVHGAKTRPDPYPTNIPCCLFPGAGRAHMSRRRSHD